MAIINSPNVTATGVITHDGAGGFTGSTQTQYAVTCGDASNGLQNVASLGSSGQVLTSNGAGALPSFQDAVDTGALIYVSTQTASTTAALQFTGMTQDTYLLVFRNLIPSSENSSHYFAIQVSNDNGATWASSNYQYAVQYLNVASGTVSANVSTSSSEIKITPTGTSTAVGSGTGEDGVNGFALLTNCNNASKAAHFEFNLSYLSLTADYVHVTGGGASTLGGASNTTDVDAIQIYHTNGNTASGEILLYYLKEA